MLQEMQATTQTTIITTTTMQAKMLTTTQTITQTKMLAKTQVVQTQTIVSVRNKKEADKVSFLCDRKLCFSQLTVIIDTRNIEEERSRRRS